MRYCKSSRSAALLTPCCRTGRIIPLNRSSSVTGARQRSRHAVRSFHQGTLYLVGWSLSFQACRRVAIGPLKRIAITRNGLIQPKRNAAGLKPSLSAQSALSYKTHKCCCSPTCKLNAVWQFLLIEMICIRRFFKSMLMPSEG